MKIEEVFKHGTKKPEEFFQLWKEKYGEKWLSLSSQSDFLVVL
jgi:hypothetical protein